VAMTEKRMKRLALGCRLASPERYCLMEFMGSV